MSDSRLIIWKTSCAWPGSLIMWKWDLDLPGWGSGLSDSTVQISANTHRTDTDTVTAVAS